MCVCVWYGVCVCVCINLFFPRCTTTAQPKCMRYWPGSFSGDASEGSQCADDVGASSQYANVTVRIVSSELIMDNTVAHTTMELTHREVSVLTEKVF